MGPPHLPNLTLHHGLLHPLLAWSSAAHQTTVFRNQQPPPGMDYSLDEELLAIASIYSEDLISASASDPSQHILTVPNTSGVQLRLVFPATYPAHPPTVPAVVSAGSSTAHGWAHHVLDAVRAVLARVWTPGDPVLFPLLEELQGSTFAAPPAGADDGSAESPAADAQRADAGVPAETRAPPRPVPVWSASGVLTEKKSVFVAHAAPIASAAEARECVAALIASDRKFGKATHNISAFRGRFKRETAAATAGWDGDAGNCAAAELVFQDCDDDGEDAAGGRLLHLLELTGSWDVVVVVSRWYGGVKLGPDRFRLINQVAREALVEGGFVREESKKGGKKGR